MLAPAYRRELLSSQSTRRVAARLPSLVDLRESWPDHEAEVHALRSKGLRGAVFVALRTQRHAFLAYAVTRL